MEEALALLVRLRAPDHLIRHAHLVCGVASQLCDAVHALDVSLEVDFVLAGAMLHDCGKVEHPEELHVAGHKHEQTGRQRLLELGVEPRLANVCVTHAQWSHHTCTLEELLVALADKLWKGKRVQRLEECVILGLQQRTSQTPWDVYMHATSLFERIAQQGDERLIQSLGGR